MPAGWKRLDLRNKATMPPPDTLVVLYLRPIKNSGFYDSEQYEIGCFKVGTGQRKLWWQSMRNVNDPVKMRRHYDIWWCAVPEFDGF